MKGFFQLVNPLNGVRSQAVSRNRKEFAAFLAETKDELVYDPQRGPAIENVELRSKLSSMTIADCYVLVLVELPDADSMENTVQWMFSEAPMMRVSTFIKNYSE